MRGDGADDIPDFLVETCRAAFELRQPDAHGKATDALRRCRRATDAIREHRNRQCAPDFAGPNPETLVHQRRRLRDDTVESLIRSGKLAWRQEVSALQIAGVYEGVTAQLMAKVARWELGRIDGGRGGLVCEQLADAYRRRFLPWSSWMANPENRFQAA